MTDSPDAQVFKGKELTTIHATRATLSAETFKDIAFPADLVAVSTCEAFNPMYYGGGGGPQNMALDIGRMSKSPPDHPIAITIKSPPYTPAERAALRAHDILTGKPL